MAKTVLLLYQHDGLANTQRAEKVAEALTKAGAKVNMVDTDEFFSIQYQYFYRPLSEVISFYVQKVWPFSKLKWLFRKNESLFYELQKRAEILSKAAFFKEAAVIVCQSNYDFLSFFKKARAQVFVFDSPTPFSLELEYSPQAINHKELIKIREKERIVYKLVDAVCFNWVGYKELYERLFNFRFSNYMEGNSGTTKVKQLATYSKRKRIVFLGSLDEYWVNKPLLKELLKKSRYQIDVYGKTKDRNITKLKNYKGYLPPEKHAVLAKYQFGLITLSDDPLRSNGFSAKQMLYLSYGLPLLVPEWRQNKYFDAATVRYNAADFNEVIDSFSSQEKWQKKHKNALLLARKNSWEENLHNLVKFILKKRRTV